MKILLLYVHPDHKHSHANRALRNELIKVFADTGNQLTVHDLYHAYPDGLIQHRAERSLLEAHDAIIVQHPMYWFSAPALFKEWLDRVLTSDWAFGAGFALADLPWLHVITTGGSATDFRGDLANPSTDMLLLPLKQTVEYCKMVWLPPVVVHDADSASPAVLQAAAMQTKDRLTLK